MLAHITRKSSQTICSECEILQDQMDVATDSIVEIVHKASTKPDGKSQQLSKAQEAGDHVLRKARIWIVAFGLLASRAALCQTSNVQTSANTLPDAPSVQNESVQAAAIQTQPLQEVFNVARLRVRERATVLAASAVGAAHADFGHFDRQRPIQNQSRDRLANRIFASTASRSNSNRISESESLIRRAGFAAESVVVTHDDAGRKKLNTSYLLRVLTTIAAHSAAANSAASNTAYVPYWKRPRSRPASDFGSTIGNDAGMKVFHEFKPAILHLVKSHEPKFVSSIGERIGYK